MSARAKRVDPAAGRVVSTWARRWEDVREVGKVRRRVLPSGKIRYQLDFGRISGPDGVARQVRLDSRPDGLGGRVAFLSEHDADEFLRIHPQWNWERSPSRSAAPARGSRH